MRPRNRISDPEQSPEETATISKRGSSQRAAANRARQWLASGESDNDHRQLQSPEQPSTSSSSRARASRMVIPPNGNSNSSTASTTRSPRKTTNSTAGEGGSSSRSTATRRLRNISQSEPSVTPPPHTVDHNYGEPSSRRSSRNRHQLSRHQRNADELDQTPEEDEDAHTAAEEPTDDTSDDAPLRPRAAPRTNQISSRLRSKTASPAKRGKKSSGTSEEDDGARQDDSDEEFIGVEEESDSEEKITADSTDDDSDDNTPLRMMSKSRGSRARPPPAGRSTGATSGNISSRTRQKDRFSSEDDYGGPGPSTIRNTRNLKRPRYNEDSDDEDAGGRGGGGQPQRPKRPTLANERPHQYFGGGGPSASRLQQQRNGDATTTSNTGTDSHSEDNEALTSVSSRGRVRRIKPNVRRIFRE